MIDKFKVVNVLVEMDGKNVVFIEDRYCGGEVLTRKDLLITESPNFCICEEDLLEIRDEHPNAPVYGLWVTLYKNEMISDGIGLYLIKRNENSGFYLRLNPASPGVILKTGHYTNGLTDSGEKLNFNDGVVLSIFSQGITLDDKQVLHPSEIRYEQKAKIISQLREIVISAALGLILTAIIMMGSEDLTNTEFAGYYNQVKLLEKLNKEKVALTEKRASDKPRQFSEITQYAAILKVDPTAFFPEHTLSDEGHRIAIVNTLSVAKAKKLFPWAKRVEKINKSQEIIW